MCPAVSQARVAGAAQHKGFDDIAAAAPAEPPLTTIYNPLYEMGGTAVIRSST